MSVKTYFVSGHLDLTSEEFLDHYAPRLRAAMDEGATFVIGDAGGADAMAQAFLREAGYARATVFHMLHFPRTNLGFATVGGFRSDDDRDAAMTRASTNDIAWVHPGREKSGTAKNVRRRTQ